MAQNRREFLHAGCKALTAGALLSGLGRFALVDALAQSAPASDYKALVCVFLFGGNDANNMIIPVTNYAQYDAVRGPASQTPADFVIPEAQFTGFELNPGGRNVLFGMNPKLRQNTIPSALNEGTGPFTTLYDLWKQPTSKVAVVCNTGPLIQPITRAQYRAGGTNIRPYQLFSHSDQQNTWQTGFATRPKQTGWAGATADKTHLVTEQFPAISSIAGVTVFSTGQNTRPLVLAPFPTKLGDSLRLLRTNDQQAIIDALTASGPDPMPVLIKGASDITRTALDVSTALGSADPRVDTAFPTTSLGNQLKQIAKVISFIKDNPGLGVRRQIFFASIGGFDTHTGQGVFNSDPDVTDNGQLRLLRQLSQAIGSLYQATVELGLENQVTIFTSSDFSRTFVPGGGSTGTDHAWGSHQFVVGGAVKGGDFYGQYPSLIVGDDGTLDTDGGGNARGRWIPTTSVDQYAATLANWYGLTSPADQDMVFPNLQNFGSNRLLGFL